MADVPDDAIDMRRIETLANWLIAGALPPRSVPDVVAEVGQMVVASGVRLGILEVMRMVVHPVLPASHTYWRPGHAVGRLDYAMEDVLSPNFIGSPPDIVMKTRRMVRHKFDEVEPEGEHPFMAYRRSRGYTECAFFPLHSVDGSILALGASTRSANGWTDQEIEVFRRIQAPIARVTEAMDLKRSDLDPYDNLARENAPRPIER